jgi:group I intron endonuclease
MSLDLPTLAQKTGIYCIRNLFDGKEYVGSAARGFKRRWKAHIRQLRANCHVNWLLQAAWNTCGESAFAFEVLEECAPEQCIAKEQERIDAMDPEYNLCREAGSTMGRKCTETCREKHRIAMLGNKHALGSRGLVGYIHTPEARANMREAHIGYRHSPQAISHMLGNRNHLGHTGSVKSREKMRLAQLGNKNGVGNLGRQHTQEARIKISEALKLRWKNHRLLLQPI